MSSVVRSFAAAFVRLIRSQQPPPQSRPPSGPFYVPPLPYSNQRPLLPLLLGFLACAVSPLFFDSWRIPCDMSPFPPKNHERTPRTIGQTTYFAIRLDKGRPVWDTSPVEAFRDYKMLATSAPPRVHSHVSSALRPRLAPIDFGC